MAVETDLAVLYRDVSARITNMLLRVRRDGGKVTPTNRQFIIAQLKRLGLDMVRLDFYQKFRLSGVSQFRQKLQRRPR